MKSFLFIIVALCLVQTPLSSFALPIADEKPGVLPPLISSRVHLPPVEAITTSHGSDNDTIVERGSTNVYLASLSEIKELKLTTILSANAYCRPVIPGGKWTCKNCGGSVKDFVLVKTWTTLLFDTNVMMLRHDKGKKIYVVFRGSNSLRSFAADMVFFTKDYEPVKGAKVHTGFYEGYLEVQRRLVPAVLAELDAHPDYKIIVTGHSLGGSHAHLHGLDLFQRDSRITPSNIEIITQGQPRTGDPGFARYTASTGLPLKRIVHQNDLVAHIPTEDFGFLHPGNEYWITTFLNVVKVCESDLETSKCSNSDFNANILDHLSYFGYNMGLCL